ncbi:hypothetical protein LV457_04435 [Mycobacterium sp. MYCO198283]|uniref:hypothetical protein n=1 Tax=Mycobacterium sp. MYCO198283 TaxID=2883505 RepID=UPI001E554547|nr:hypothetical protein [Mycobacterium sp. MYCO198283]MCG5431537.1 hypothetical protein [Mycobacterium sp. MYCO198283]
MTWRCHVVGHRPVFRADGATLRWECRHGCGEGGAKTYPTAERARRYAEAFNRGDGSNLGERAPLLGLLPLRVWRLIRNRRAVSDDSPTVNP